jgi:hypothetical protein
MRRKGIEEWIRYNYCVHMYVNGKWDSLKLFQGWVEGDKVMERVNSSIIYCKNFCKYQNVPQAQQEIFK